MFKVGDLVRRIEDDSIGIVTKFHKNMNSEGFSTDIYNIYNGNLFYTNWFFPERYFDLIDKK